MNIEPFALERMQSTWENLVDYNLSESGVHPLSFAELSETIRTPSPAWPNRNSATAKPMAPSRCANDRRRSIRVRRPTTSWSPTGPRKPTSSQPGALSSRTTRWS